MNNEDAQLAGVVESLNNAGIGSAYHRRSLKEVSQALADIAKTELRIGAQEGRGLFFVGSLRAADATILAARALHLQGIRCCVVRLTRLIDWLDNNADNLTQAEDADALFVLDFQDTHERPFTGWQARKVETLISDRLDQGGAFFAQGTRTLEGVGGWWSETFVAAVARSSPVWEM